MRQGRKELSDASYLRKQQIFCRKTSLGGGGVPSETASTAKTACHRTQKHPANDAHEKMKSDSNKLLQCNKTT
jgi:hypothetical protein